MIVTYVSLDCYIGQHNCHLCQPRLSTLSALTLSQNCQPWLSALLTMVVSSVSMIVRSVGHDCQFGKHDCQLCRPWCQFGKHDCQLCRPWCQFGKHDCQLCNHWLSATVTGSVCQRWLLAMVVSSVSHDCRQHEHQLSQPCLSVCQPWLSPRSTTVVTSVSHDWRLWLSALVVSRDC